MFVKEDYVFSCAESAIKSTDLQKWKFFKQWF